MRQLNPPNPFIVAHQFVPDTPAQSLRCCACKRFFTGSANRADVVLCTHCGFRQFRKWARW